MSVSGLLAALLKRRREGDRPKVTGSAGESGHSRQPAEDVPVPRHIAIIMDGNGRWAQSRGRPRLEGHRAGARSIRDTIKACVKLGVEYLTIYTFSSENWSRPEDEVDGLMALFESTLNKELPELDSQGVRIRVIGRTSDLPESTRSAFAAAEDKTAGNSRLCLGVALNYGGRTEILDAVRELAGKAAAGEIEPAKITGEDLSEALYSQGIPDPELLIRTGGEIRISNFLLWQVAYAELWFTPVLWPDFKPGHLEEAIAEYQRRNRRFGGLSQTAQTKG